MKAKKLLAIKNILEKYQKPKEIKKEEAAPSITKTRIRDETPSSRLRNRS